MMVSTDRIAVEEVAASDIRRGDRVWAPNDGDWLLVDRLNQDSVFDSVTFYRHDYSEADFRLNQRVLRRV